jgi:hypothetical protein
MSNAKDVLNGLKALLKSLEPTESFMPNKALGGEVPTQKQLRQIAEQAKDLNYEQTKLFLGSLNEDIIDKVRKGVTESMAQCEEDSYIGGAVMGTPKGLVRLDGNGMLDFFGLKSNEPVNTKADKEYTDENTTSKFVNHYRAPASISQYFESLASARTEATKYAARHVGTTHVVFDNDTDEIVHTCVVEKEEMYALH